MFVTNVSQLLLLSLSSVPVKKSADFEDWRELALSHDWLWKLTDAKVVKGKSNQSVHLVLGGAFVPLLQHKMWNHIWKARDNFGERLGIPVLLEYVEEPVVEVLLKGRMEELV